MEHTFVVLTPTYQRVNTLPRLYKSLCAQTYKDFLWLIIDDGSTDGTDNLVESFIKEGKIDIEYHWKENGGKHTAIKEADKYIDTTRYKYVAPMDSDDIFVERSLEIFYSHWLNINSQKLQDSIGCIKSRCKVYGGPQFDYKTPQDRFIDVEYKYVTYELGDFCEYASCSMVVAFKKYLVPHETFWCGAMCKYFPEGIMWNRLGNKYIFRYIPDVTRIYYMDAPDSLVRLKGRAEIRKKNLYPRMVAVKYLLSENMADYIKYQKIRLLKKMALFSCCWYELDIPWTECYLQLDKALLRILFVLYTPFTPMLSFIFKKFGIY